MRSLLNYGSYGSLFLSGFLSSALLQLGLTHGATLDSVLGSILVQAEGEESDDLLVTTESGFQLVDDGGLTLKLNQGVKTSVLVLDGICELAQSPVLFVLDVAKIS